MKRMSLTEMELLGGGDSRRTWAMIGCLSSAVGLAGAFVGLGAVTAGIGWAIAAIGGYSASLGALVYSCSHVNE